MFVFYHNAFYNILKSFFPTFQMLISRYENYSDLEYLRTKIEELMIK